MRITRDMLLNPEHGEGVSEGEICKVEESLQRGVFSDQWVVWAWEDAPNAVRKLCNWNGGDEDWVAVRRQEPEYLPNWVERLDTCHDPDVYVLNGVVVYVGNHA